MSELVPFARTLEQELLALARGVSLECLVCGEFVIHRGDAIACPECGSVLRAAVGATGTEPLRLWRVAGGGGPEGTVRR